MASRIDPATGKCYRRPIINLADLREGDVLRSPAGTLRVIRSINPRRSAGSATVTFVIRHCSWTHRPITIYCVRELEQMGYIKAGVRVHLDRELDKRIAAEVRNSGKPELHCCDVRGIA